MIGTTVEDMQRTSAAELAVSQWRHRPLAQADRDQLILGILQRIDSPALRAAGEARKNDWESGWQENLTAFVETNYDVEQLVPRYFKKHAPVRLLGEYAIPSDPDLVLNCSRLLRSWIARTYLSSASAIYEFGCGPASHLAYLAQFLPGKRLYGLDWAESSQKIIQAMAQRFGWPIRGANFDFFKPDPTVELEEGAAVLTFGALEQVGQRFEPFLDFLLQRRPEICVHVECLLELYDSQSLFDYLAVKYHLRRNYLQGFLPRLRELESQKKIEIVACHHVPFGNLYDDTHSYVIWRPRRAAVYQETGARNGSNEDRP